MEEWHEERRRLLAEPYELRDYVLDSWCMDGSVPAVAVDPRNPSEFWLCERRRDAYRRWRVFASLLVLLRRIPSRLRLLLVDLLAPVLPIRRTRPAQQDRAAPPTVAMLVAVLDHAGSPQQHRSARGALAA